MVRWFLGLFAASLVALTAPLAAETAADVEAGVPGAPPKDAWHTVGPNSPFFSADMADLRIAAVVQSDDRFARIILGEDGSGAYVTVNLPGSEPAEAVRSDLVYSNGGVLTRTLSADMLEAQVMTSSDSVTYSFSVAAEDIRVFRGATKWTLTPKGGTPTEITLKGSARAIRTALSTPRPAAEDTAGPVSAQYDGGEPAPIATEATQ